MREIKFRAWHVKYGIIGNILNIAPYINTEADFKLMQYTGLKDKNAKEVYEGDIIKHNVDDMVGVVTYSAGLYRFVIENLAQTEIIADLCDYDFEPEVLGNIYENPELVSAKVE